MELSNRPEQPLASPLALSPIVMSLTALGVVLLHLARIGAAREADEGTAAHLWQLLMAGQLPLIVWFAATGLPRRPGATARILALQAAAVVAAAFPVWWFGL